MKGGGDARRHRRHPTGQAGRAFEPQRDRKAGGAGAQEQLRQPADLRPQEQDRMLRDQPKGDAELVVLPGQVAALLRLRQRPQPRSRLLHRYAVALGDDVDAPDVDEDLHRLVARGRRAQRALIAELPAPHDHDPRRRERSDHPEGNTPIPSQGTTGNEKPGADGQREEERDRPRERRRREQCPHQKALPRSRPLAGDEGHRDRGARHDEKGERRLRQEQAGGRHRRQIDGEKQAGHHARPKPPEPPGDPRAEAHGQHTESDPDEDHGARIFSGHHVDGRDQEGEARHAAALSRAVGAFCEAPVIEQGACELFVPVRVRPHHAGGIQAGRAQEGGQTHGQGKPGHRDECRTPRAERSRHVRAGSNRRCFGHGWSRL